MGLHVSKIKKEKWKKKKKKNAVKEEHEHEHEENEEDEKNDKFEVPPPDPVASLEGVPDHDLLNIDVLKSRPLAPRTKTQMRKTRPQKPPRTSLGKNDKNTIKVADPESRQIEINSDGASAGVNEIDTTDAVHKRLTLKQNDSLEENIAMRTSQEKDDKDCTSPKIFLKPRRMTDSSEKETSNIKENLEKLFLKPRPTTGSSETERSSTKENLEDDKESTSPKISLEPRRMTNSSEKEMACIKEDLEDGKDCISPNIKEDLEKLFLKPRPMTVSSETETSSAKEDLAHDKECISPKILLEPKRIADSSETETSSTKEDLEDKNECISPNIKEDLEKLFLKPRPMAGRSVKETSSVKEDPEDDKKCTSPKIFLKPRKTTGSFEKETSSSKEDLVEENTTKIVEKQVVEKEEDIKSSEVKSELTVKPATPIYGKPYKIEAQNSKEVLEDDKKRISPKIFLKPRKTTGSFEKETSSSKEDLVEENTTKIVEKQVVEKEEDIKSSEVKSELTVKPATPIYGKPYKIEAQNSKEVLEDDKKRISPKIFLKPRKTRECSEKEASSSKDDLEEDIKSPEVKSEVAVKPATPIHAKPYKIEAAAAEDPKEEEEIEARIIHLMYNPRVEGKTEVDAEENPEREPVTEETVAAETVAEVATMSSPAILSSPVNIPDDLFLRPSKKRSVTSIRLDEAFTILEDEMVEEPGLTVSEDIEQSVLPGGDQNETLRQISTND